jgi:hypothetical protein
MRARIRAAKSCVAVACSGEMEVTAINKIRSILAIDSFAANEIDQLSAVMHKLGLAK